MVVIDEFATLKAELPEFIDALVGVAQRGRSLGVHLLLATQRPQGAINDNIRANTNLRIALRVQDAADSTDVIDVPDAAAIPRTAPGRAYVRLGPGEVVAIQTALSTGLARRGSAGRRRRGAVRVRAGAAVDGPRPGCRRRRRQGRPTRRRAGSDLAVLVDAINEAFAAPAGRARGGRGPIRCPATSTSTPDRRGGGRRRRGARPVYVPVALADDPDRQRQYPTGWRAGRRQPARVRHGRQRHHYGPSQPGTVAGPAPPPDDLHLYVVDFGAGELAVLGGIAPLRRRAAGQRA